MPDKKEPAPDYVTKTPRPWGYFRLLDQGPGFSVKALFVKGEQRLSLQRHAHRAERWTVAMGHAVATVHGVKHALAPGDSIRIPVGAAHRLANPAKESLVVIEVQVGECDELDIIRISDDYGRVTPCQCKDPLDKGITHCQDKPCFTTPAIIVSLKEKQFIPPHPGGRNF